MVHTIWELVGEGLANQTEPLNDLKVEVGET